MGTLRILPLLILVAMFSFVVRLGDVVTKVKTKEQAFSGSVMAASDKEAEEGDAKPKDGEKAPAKVEVPKGLSKDEPAPLPKGRWADPETMDYKFSETQRTILNELKERRVSLDDRESRVRQREALVEVTENRVEEKIAELDAIRNEIKELLGTQSDQEEQRLQSLVKIYSGMKPKDAAAIFDNLNIDILLQVVSRMSERKTAPILAAMNVQKAQELTTLLAEQVKLPDFNE